MSKLKAFFRKLTGPEIPLKNPLEKPVPLSANMDLWLLGGVLLLMGLGLVMVFSASATRAEHDIGNPYYFLERQAAYLVLSLAALFAAARVPVEFWRERSPALLLVSVLMLALVLIPGLGITVNASRRWLNLLIFRVQPSEIFKFTLLVFMAGYVVRKGKSMQSLRDGLLPVVAIIGVAGLLLLMEPDMGALVIAVAIAGGIIFLGGLPMRYVAVGGGAAAAMLAWLAVAQPYRLARITSFRDPWAHPLDTGFQLVQSLIAFGRGGVFGVGLGEGIQKMFYLPEAHTDFILAVIGEELGLVGVLAVIGLFVLVTFRMYRIGQAAERAGQLFESLVAYGVMIWFAVQAVASIGVNLGALPTKGLTLPLMSYGGSSLIVMAAAIGVVVGIGARVQPVKRRKRVRVGEEVA